MTNTHQIEANRMNTQTSPGPQVEGGTTAPRLNTLKQGLRSESIGVLPDEDGQRFAARLDTWFRELAPNSEAEVLLIRQAALLSWRLDRADRHETATLTQKMLDAIESSEIEDTAAILRTAALAAFDSSVQGERLRRYQFTLQRELRKTLEAIAKLKQTAAKEAKPATNKAATLIEPKPDSPKAAPVPASPIATRATKATSTPPSPIKPIESLKERPRPTTAPIEPIARPTRGSLREKARPSIPAGWERRRKTAMEMLAGKPCVLAETSLLTPRGSGKPEPRR